MNLQSHSPFLRFYVYKLPKEHGKKSPQRGEMYLLLEKGSEGWTSGKETVNDTTGALGRTVGQLYSQGQVCFHQEHFFIPNKNGTNTTFVCFIEILGPFCRKSIDRDRVC